jgi:hypothetical protein
MARAGPVSHAKQIAIAPAWYKLLCFDEDGTGIDFAGSGGAALAAFGTTAGRIALSRMGPAGIRAIPDS